MSLGFTIAAILSVFLAFAHSYLGERFLLKRLLRLELPALLGDDTFTKATLRFAWHATSIVWFGMAAILLLAPGPVVGWVVVAVLGATSVMTIIISRARHLSWAIELVAVAALVIDLV